MFQMVLGRARGLRLGFGVGTVKTLLLRRVMIGEAPLAPFMLVTPTATAWLK